MGKYEIIEVYNEKVVTTTTDSFDEAIMTYQDQIDGTSKPADKITIKMHYGGQYITICDKEL